MNLFKWIDELFVGKRDWDSFSDADKKSFSPFMIVRYLSMNKDILPLVNHYQNYIIEVMPHKAVYQFWCGVLPKRKTYLKYIKGKKDKFNKEVIDYLVRYFEVSKQQASEYVKLIPKENLIHMLKEYGKTDKEIKKMIK
tara:strand:- start:161 stop:577 length:417 start_codon:yes stop_codon:yes gene_type:complete